MKAKIHLILPLKNDFTKEIEGIHKRAISLDSKKIF